MCCYVIEMFVVTNCNGITIIEVMSENAASMIGT
jgi:hypothetical protein